MRIQRARAKIWLGRSLRQVVAAALLSVGVLFCLPGILIRGGSPYIKDPRWLNHFLRPGTQPPVEYRPPPGTAGELYGCRWTTERSGSCLWLTTCGG